MSNLADVAEVMRSLGVEEAHFDATGNVLMCRLGPEPASVKPEDDTPARDPKLTKTSSLLASVNRLQRGERLGG